MPRVGVAALWLTTICLPVLRPATAAAELPPEPHLVIRELNITGDEFVVLQNDGTAPIDHMNAYWLGYTSTENVPNVIPSQQLPDVPLQPQQALLLNNGMASVCGAVAVAKLGFTLSNTSGTLALRQLITNTDTTSTFQTVQYVSWGKKSPTGPQYANISDESLVASYQSSVGGSVTASTLAWYDGVIMPTDTGSAWHVGFISDCTFTPVISKTAVSDNLPVAWTQDTDFVPSVAAPAQFITDAGGPSLPVADIGLKALQLSELLPNPASPQTDADDEFIELYNPNSTVFDLTGFKFQVGSTTSSTTHTYTFPVGTLVSPKGFMAFMSAETHLSLSNSGGQVWLLDPFGNTVANSDVYDTAKEGMAWVNASGHWQWTALPTPNEINKVSPPASGVIGKTATVNGKNVTAVKGASTNSNGQASTTGTTPAANTVTPVHPLTLVVVVVAAILYWAYEYRTDMANRLHQFRRNRAAGRNNRS